MRYRLKLKYPLPTMGSLAECCKGPIKYWDIGCWEAVICIDIKGIFGPDLTAKVDTVPMSELEK